MTEELKLYYLLGVLAFSVAINVFMLFLCYDTQRKLDKAKGRSRSCTRKATGYKQAWLGAELQLFDERTRRRGWWS